MSDTLAIAPHLDADDAVDGLVSDHAMAVADADAASRRIGEAPWWRRRAARAEHAALVRLAEQLADDVRAVDGWARFVDRLVIDEWRTMQRAVSTRHAFHPSLASSVPAHRASIAQSIGAKRVTLLPEVAHGIAPTDGVRVEAVPQLRELCTADRVEEVLTAEFRLVDRVRAATPLTRWTDPQRQLIVEHPMSAHRATFTSCINDPFGAINSNPAQVPSLAAGDGDRHPDVDATMNGLGIGEQIYLAGAAEFPGTRWSTAGLASPEIKALRNKLHRADPYTWEASACDWCDDNVPLWAQATPGDFEGHR